MTIDAALTLLAELEKGMKSYEFEVQSSQKKINSSFALVMAQALQSYLAGKFDEAQADLTLLVEEMTVRRSRM
jgi:hypothetical protein